MLGDVEEPFDQGEVVGGLAGAVLEIGLLAAEGVVDVVRRGRLDGRLDGRLIVNRIRGQIPIVS